jgi:putative MFS transporter
MLWVAWFAEFGVLYTYQIFLPTILSAEGHSIVKSFSYSVVIYSSVVPGYIVGGYVSEWLDRKYAIFMSFVSVAAFGTLFAHAQKPVQIMAFAGLTVFFLSIGSTAIYIATLGKSLFFLVIDPVLICAAIVVVCFGPSTRGRPLQETQLGAARESLSG